MKKLLMLSICLFGLLACGNQTNAKGQTLSSEQEPVQTFEEAAVEILQRYQNVDSEFAAERDEIYLLTLMNITPEVEIREEARGFFLNNIKHIDSVVDRCIELIKEQQTIELLSLLEAELNNFYSHPHNTVDNEICLHNVLAELYYRTANTYEEYTSKVIAMDAITILHIEALEEKHPDYVTILINQICNCIDIGLHDDAIVYGEKLRAYSADGEVEGLIYSSLLLAKAYEKTGDKKMCDEVIDSVKDLPQYAKCCEEVKEISIFNEEANNTTQEIPQEIPYIFHGMT